MQFYKSLSMIVVLCLCSLSITSLVSEADVKPATESDPVDLKDRDIASRDTVFDSDGDGFTDDVDVSPFGDLYLNVSVTYYSQDTVDDIDSLDDGDPYFELEVDIDGDGILDFNHETLSHENAAVLYEPFEYEVNVDDDISLTRFLIWVYDYDSMSGDDILDYTPEDGEGYQHTLETDDLSATFSYDYDGEDDGTVGEKDCHIKYEAEFVIKETVITLGEFDNWDDMDYYYAFEFPDVLPGDYIEFETEITGAVDDQVSIYFLDQENFTAFENGEMCYYYPSLSSLDNGNGIVSIQNQYLLDIPNITSPPRYVHDLQPTIAWEEVLSVKKDYYFLVYNYGIDGNGANDVVDVVLRPVFEKGSGTEDVEYSLELKDVTENDVVVDTDVSTNRFQLSEELVYGHEYSISVVADNSGTVGEDSKTIHSWNEAPTVEDLYFYKHENEAYAFEPVILISDIIDYDGDQVDVAIDYDDGTMTNDSFVDLHVFTEPGSYEISVTATDGWETTVETLDLKVLEFPVDDYGDEIELDDGDQNVEFSSNYTTSLNSNVMSPWTSVLPWPFDTLKMAFSFEVEVKVEHTGYVDFEQTVDQNEEMYIIDTNLKSSHDEYQFSMIPYFKVHWQYDEESGYFLLPIPTPNEMYEGQPNMSLFGEEIYFWYDFASVGDEEVFDNKIGHRIEITKFLEIAEIDLLEFLETLVFEIFMPGSEDIWNMAKELGQTFLKLFGFEIEPVLNLSFNIKLTSNIWEKAGLVSMTDGTLEKPSGFKDEAGCLSQYNMSDNQEFEIREWEAEEAIWSSYNIMSHWIDVVISGSVGLKVGYIEIENPWWCLNCGPERIPHIKYIELFDTASLGLLMGAETFETQFGTTYTVLKNVDTDGDGIFDPVDEDDDGDGYNDTIEIEEGTDVLDPDSFPDDNDGDLVPDSLDADDDDDGYNDTVEITEKTDPMDPTSTPKDADGDFIPNSMDPDFKKKGDQGGPLGYENMVLMVILCMVVIVLFRKKNGL